MQADVRADKKPLSSSKLTESVKFNVWINGVEGGLDLTGLSDLKNGEIWIKKELTGQFESRSKITRNVAVENRSEVCVWRGAYEYLF